MTAYYLFISPRRKKTLWGLLCVYPEGVSPIFFTEPRCWLGIYCRLLACCWNGDHCSPTSLQLFQISKTWTVKLLLAVRHDVKRKKCTNTKGKSFIIRCCYTRKFKRRGLASYCGSGFENDERLNPLDGETRLRLTGRAMCACGLGLQSSDPVGSYLTGSPDVGYHGNRLRSRMRSVLRASALSEEADGQCDSSLLSG